jgi:hypothetical protein
VQVPTEAAPHVEDAAASLYTPQYELSLDIVVVLPYLFHVRID